MRHRGLSRPYINRTRTLTISAIIVPAMVFAVMPAIDRFLKRWIAAVPETRSPISHRKAAEAKAVLSAILLLAFFTPAMAAEHDPRKTMLSRAEIYYVEAGSGTQVRLIHGLGADLSIWRYNFEVLSSDHHLVALNFYGVGQSIRLAGEYRAQVFVDHIEDLQQTPSAAFRCLSASLPAAENGFLAERSLRCV